jgi:hypothetical protein
MRINDESVTLQGDCQANEMCNYTDFVGLAKNVSFYGDMKGYYQLCKPGQNITTEIPTVSRPQNLLRTNQNPGQDHLGIWQ